MPNEERADRPIDGDSVASYVYAIRGDGVIRGDSRFLRLRAATRVARLTSAILSRRAMDDGHCYDAERLPDLLHATQFGAMGRIPVPSRC